ncbi:MAG: DNA-directed RNA polymerase subunit B'' [Candidatus Aenigmatarchaeota archaeon]
MKGKKLQALLKAFKSEKGFAKYQIEAYNRFVDERLQEIIDGIGEIEPESEKLGDFKIELGEVRVGEPSVKEADGSLRQILPKEARLRDITYSAPIFLEMTTKADGEVHEQKEVKIGELPVMVRSKKCPLSDMTDEELIEAGEDPQDLGGYFLINGTERVLMLLEEVAPNRVIVEKKDKKKVEYAARINSERSGWGQRHTINKKRDGLLTISFANARKVPLVVVMRALGLETDKDIVQAITEEEEYQEEIYANLYETEVSDTEEALSYIGKGMNVSEEEYRKERAAEVIDKYLLPHISQDEEGRMDKAMYLGRCAKKILYVANGDLEPDDIDHYRNKRIRTSSELLEILIRSKLLGRVGLISRIKYNYKKIARRGKVPTINTVVESDMLTGQIQSAFATGLWVGGRSGVSQRLERTNYIKTLSHLRNVTSPLSTQQEHFDARQLHATHWGRLGATQTPEGPTIGLRKYLALMASISTGLPKDETEQSLETLETEIKR